MIQILHKLTEVLDALNAHKSQKILVSKESFDNISNSIIAPFSLEYDLKDVEPKMECQVLSIDGYVISFFHN